MILINTHCLNYYYHSSYYISLIIVTISPIIKTIPAADAMIFWLLVPNFVRTLETLNPTFTNLPNLILDLLVSLQLHLSGL